MIYILLVAGGITAALEEWIDAGVIFAVVLVNAIIGFLQESKAARALEALAKMTVTEASVLRSGEVQRIPSVELVPGDIVLLQSGDKVPADLRLFQSRDLQIDESTLTGRIGSCAEKPRTIARRNSAGRTPQPGVFLDAGHVRARARRRVCHGRKNGSGTNQRVGVDRRLSCRRR